MRTIILTTAVAVASAFTALAQPGQTLLSETLNMESCHMRFARFGVSRQELLDSIEAAGYESKSVNENAILIRHQGKNYVALIKDGKYSSFAVQILHDRMSEALQTMRVLQADAKLLNTLELTNELKSKMYATQCYGSTHFVMLSVDSTYTLTVAYGYVNQ